MTAVSSSPGSANATATSAIRRRSSPRPMAASIDSARMRAAFYALRPGGWRDYVTLIHPPYTLWNLSYVAIGAALAPDWRPLRLGAGLAAFFLGLGVAAHALDELHDRPLKTEIPDRVLWALAAVALAGAVGIGVAASIAWTPWLAAFVAACGFVV